MDNEFIVKIKREIINAGKMLWEKGLVNGLNGNISRRVDEHTVALTATKVCLGLLTEKDILLMNMDGGMISDGHVSTEKTLHADIYRGFAEINAVIHTHTTFVNGYFLEEKIFVPRIIESKLFLGSIEGIDQTTPSVTDTGPVIDALKSNNIVVLRKHGVLSMGRELMDAFWLVQGLEEAVKAEAVSKIFKSSGIPQAASRKENDKGGSAGVYELFSREQIDEIVRLVNADEQMKDLGRKTDMTFDLAVKMEETGQVYKFDFEQGRIRDVSHDDKAEFLITAPEKVWRAVFNQEIDPFVATTQKKMVLRGDFGKISKWYAPCSRVFELWQKVPVK